jgi:hypothetical protein
MDKRICGTCEKEKLLIPQFWVRNSKVKSGFVTHQCKQCRNEKTKKNRIRQFGIPFYEITGTKSPLRVVLNNLDSLKENYLKREK